MNPVIAAVAAGMAVLAFGGGITLSRAGRSAERVAARLGAFHAPPPRERTPWLAGVADRVATTGIGKRIHTYARKAHPGVPFSDVLAWAATGLIAAAFFGHLLFGGGPLVVVSALLGPVMADRVAAKMSGRRIIRLESLLPDALYLQASSLRAGHSTARSLEVMAAQTAAPLGQELSHTVRAIELGLPIERALDDLAQRTGSRDVELWVTAMQVHRATGGNLTAIIGSLAAQIKERAQMRAEIRALTAQGRLSGMVVAAAPIAFFLLLSVTAKEQMAVLYSTPTGLMLLAAGIALEAAGFVWIRLILRIKT